MWNELTFLWNELTILWNDLTIDWNDLTWNDLTMERNDRKSKTGFHDFTTFALRRDVCLIRVRNKLKLRPTIPQGSRDLVELFDCQESLHM